MAKRAAKAAAAIEGKVVEIVTRTTERRTGDEENTEISAATDEAGEDDVLATLDDLGDDSGRLDIRRTSPIEFAGYVGTYQAEGFTLERLQDEWGGGKFTIRVKNSVGQFQAIRHIQVAGKPKNKEAPVAPLAAVPTQAPAQQVDVAGIIAAAQATMKPQLDMLTSLIGKLIERPAPEQPRQPDPLAMLEKAANILKPRGSDSEGAMAALMKGIDLGRSFAEGGGGGEPGMASVFMEGIKTIKEAAVISQGQPQPRPAQRRIAAPPPGSVPALAPAEAPNNPEKPVLTDTMKQVGWIKQQAAFLVVQASRKKSPELYAELFLDNLPPFLPEKLVHEQMKAPDAISKLGMLNAKVLEFPEWFEEFRAAVVTFIEEPEDDAADFEEPTGAVLEAPPEGGSDDGAGGS